jgi:hypothetical protein
MSAPHNPAHPSDGGLQREGVLAFTVSDSLRGGGIARGARNTSHSELSSHDGRDKTEPRCSFSAAIRVGAWNTSVAFVRFGAITLYRRHQTMHQPTLHVYRTVARTGVPGSPTGVACPRV